MSIEVAAFLLKEAVGATIASGPDGFGIHHEVAGNANIDANTTGVEVKLNKQSQAAATANHESGFNKRIAAAVKAQEKYQSVLKKSGADKTLSRVAGRGMAARNQLRLAPVEVKGEKKEAAPPRRMQNRKQDITRATFDQMKQFMLKRQQIAAVPDKKTVAINPQAMMQKAALYKKNKDKNWAGMIVAPGFAMDG